MRNMVKNGVRYINGRPRTEFPGRLSDDEYAAISSGTICRSRNNRDRKEARRKRMEAWNGKDDILQHDGE